MPAPEPAESRRRAVTLARLREKPIRGITHYLRIAHWCLRRWMRFDDIDDGHAEGVTTDEHAELVGFAGDCTWRRGIEILEQASVSSTPTTCFRTRVIVLAGR